MFRALISAMLSVLLSACLGGGIWGTVHGTIEHPTIGRTKGELAGPRDPFYFGTQYEVTRKSLVTYWGKPDEIEILPDGREKYTYRFGLRWSGIGLWAFIAPVPLLVPIGSDYIQFTIDNGIVTAVETVDEDVRFGGWCGISILPHHSGWFCEGQRLKHREAGRVGDDFRFERDFDPIKE